MTKNTNKHNNSSSKQISDTIADNTTVKPEILADESAQRAGITQDGFCRKILDDQIIAADVLRNYADPAIAECIDLDKLHPERTNFFGNVQGNPFKEFRSDIPYTAPLVDDTNGYMVLLLFEHKSILGHFVFIQIYAYMLLANYDKWRRADCPTSKSSFRPYIMIGIVIFCGEDKDNDVAYFQDMYENLPEALRIYVPQSKLVRINLNNFSYDNLPGRPETQAFVETMKRLYDGTLQGNLSTILERFRTTAIDRRIEEVIYSICTFIYSKTKINFDECAEVVRTLVQGKKGEEMAEKMLTGTYAEMCTKLYAEAYTDIIQTEGPKLEARGIAKGKAEGKAEGKTEGKAEGKAESILKLLDRRFNNVSSGIREQVLSKRDPIVLDALMDHVFDCKTIDEFADLL